MLTIEQKRERRRQYYLRNRDRILAAAKARRLAKKGAVDYIGDIGDFDGLYFNVDDIDGVNPM